MSYLDKGSLPDMPHNGFADDVRGQQPHVVDREVSALLQDNYAVADLRRGMGGNAQQLPGTWARMDDDDVRSAGIDPALMHDAKSGFDSSFYRDAQGRVLLVFTGTDEGRDWKHNLMQGLGLKDQQYDRAINLGQKAKDIFGDNVVFAGHSLGGGLAAAASMVNEVPAVTFNAAGVHDKTIERYGLDADVLKQEAEHGLIRAYQVKNEILTHLQEDSVPLKWAMPDAAGHRIELPDPDPLTFFERLVPGSMLKHRLDLHLIDAVMEAQDLSQLEVRERNPGSGTGTIGDADSVSNRLLRDAVDGLSAQRRQLGLEVDEHFFNTAACVAANAGSEGMKRIDHVLASERGHSAISVQGALHDPAQQRSRVEVERASQVPAQVSAAQLREQDQQQVPAQQFEQRQLRAVQY